MWGTSQCRARHICQVRPPTLSVGSFFTLILMRRHVLPLLIAMAAATSLCLYPLMFPPVIEFSSNASWKADRSRQLLWLTRHRTLFDQATVSTLIRDKRLKVCESGARASEIGMVPYIYFEMAPQAALPNWLADTRGMRNSGTRGRFIDKYFHFGWPCRSTVYRITCFEGGYVYRWSSADLVLSSRVSGASYWLWPWPESVRFKAWLCSVAAFHACLLPVFVVPRFVRRRLCLKRGLCPACAYPVGESALCSECGAEVIPARSRLDNVS